MTEQWNRRAQPELRVEGCRRRGPQASPRPEPTPTVWGPPRRVPTVRVIILPRKTATANPLGTRTADRHRWSGRTY